MLEVASTDTCLFQAIKTALQAVDIDQKLARVWCLARAYQDGLLKRSASHVPVPIQQPGMPSALELVAPKALVQRSLHTQTGRLAMIHAIAHIEYNAIHLALDAAYRFQDMPEAYYTDWLRVAVEEAYHFSLLRNLLQEKQVEYGAFPAHNGLWDMAEQTAHDVLVRMALVPRVMEARGLDVTPGIQAKFKAIGDQPMVDILSVIERDEIGHVQIGNHWYRYCCAQRQCDPLEMFQALIAEHAPKVLRPPIAEKNRQKAGFEQAELDWLMGQLA